MNQRNEQGWCIPRHGTKSEQIYDLLMAGFSSEEIINLMKDDYYSKIVISVLIYNIKHPELRNKKSNEFYHAHKREINLRMAAQRTEKRQRYSKYVRKLVKVLRISYTEAVRLEQEGTK